MNLKTWDSRTHHQRTFGSILFSRLRAWNFRNGPQISNGEWAKREARRSLTYSRIGGRRLPWLASRQQFPACRLLLFAAAFVATVSPVMAIDLTPLWNFDDPIQSEQRFRSALVTATGDDAAILQTQIARSYGLRGNFPKAQEILKGLEPGLQTASAEARTRYWLELGRTYSSATHSPESQTPDTKERARQAYKQAFETAESAQLDGLAVDALHMLAFVDTEPADQLKWGLRALALVQASSQSSAKKWEPSLRNNVGYALYQLGRYEEALDQFKRAVVLRERGSDLQATRVAYWMVGWTLRALNRIDEALEIQLRLERERQAAGAPSPYVFEELELLYRAKGDEALATHYAALKESVAK